MKYIFTFFALCATMSFGQTTSYPIYEGVFDGTTHVQSLEFPSTAQAWAGFSNNNAEIYPLSFPNGGEITFKASASAAANLKFRFEANPYPNVDPAHNTANIPITAAEDTYTVAIPSQGANTFNSAILYIVERDITVNISEVKITAAAGDPTTNATLSDLKVDGVTIDGFDKAVKSYTYKLPTGTTVAPQISSATTAINGATTAITQAASVPGDATVVVTATDGSTKDTYTVSFKAVLPATAASTPPTRNAADVISLYSDAYTDVASNFDAGWCSTNSISEISVAGNATMAYLGNTCQGIVLDAGIDASAFTNYHVDIYIEAGTDVIGKTFHLKFVGTPTSITKEVNHDINGLGLKAGQWNSLDGTVDLTTMTGFKEFSITSNLANSVYYDNLYVYKAPTASIEDLSSSFSIYPNPMGSLLTVEGVSEVQHASIFDLTGREVLSAMPNKAVFTLDTADLQHGVYMLSLQIGDTKTTHKLVK
jgi:hypothetical protein